MDFANGKEYRIPAVNQDVQIEVHFLGWKNYPNSQKRDHEAF
jgi:hypothetical protein